MEYTNYFKKWYIPHLNPTKINLVLIQNLGQSYY